MRAIITPADLPQYIPGEIWLDAVDGRWNELSIRGYKYKPSDISAPRLTDYLVVLYTGGPIASVTGFSDQGHLTRHFKRRFGITPQECRRDDSRFVPGASQYALTNTQAVP